MVRLNEVYCGRCTDLMGAMDVASVDLTVTSPPYGKLREYNGYDFNFEDIANGLYRVTKPGGVVVWIVADATIKGSETGTSFRQALYFMSLGFNLHDTMIYSKANVGMYAPRNMRYKSAFEYMLILSKGKPATYNPIKDKPTKRPGRIRHDRNGGRVAGDKLRKCAPGSRVQGAFQDRFNIWEYFTGNNLSTKDKIAFKHPAIFPEKLAEDHILSWSDLGDLVFDPMCGSGTTCKMALKNDRRFLGCDISQEYADIAKIRVNNMLTHNQQTGAK